MRRSSAILKPIHRRPDPSGNKGGVDEGVVLEVEGLSSGYGDIRVLYDVSVKLVEGRIEVILGRNGAGKTTLLSTIAGLLPCASGKVVLRGRDVTREPAFRRARDGIVLVQEGKRIFHELTVAENIIVGVQGRRMSREEAKSLVEEMLGLFPVLDGREGARAGSLSGGQQQMVAIMQALAARPSVLVLDEPSAGLAPVVVSDVFRAAAQLRDGGLSILLVEQLAEQALGVADHVSILSDGRIVASGPPEKFRDPETLRAAYFEGRHA